MSKKVFITKHYLTLILSDETKKNTFWAHCLEQSSSRILIWSYLQATLYFSILRYPGLEISVRILKVGFSLLKCYGRCNQEITVNFDY